MTRVLITNDDGIDAPGLRALGRAAAAAGLDVVVAAPLREASGMSAAMTATTESDGRVMLETRELTGLDGVPAYGVAGSPGFIALIASRGAFGPAPDLVLSGINRGANAGHAILHSGTVGAALTAAANGARAMAVSLDVLTAAAATAASGGAAIAAIDLVDDESRHWDTAAGFARDLLASLLDAPDGTVFNLNVPDAPRSGVRGLRRAGMARFGQVQMTIAEVGQGYVRTALEEGAGRLDDGTDLACLAEGYASVTPLHGITEADVPIDLPPATGADAEEETGADAGEKAGLSRG
jgi:5'-nucleotidase